MTEIERELLLLIADMLSEKLREDKWFETSRKIDELIKKVKEDKRNEIQN